jgi:toxin CcdB
VIPDQLSVHRNPGRNKSAIPFVVTVQSNRFRDSGKRAVVPLSDAGLFGVPDSDICPRFRIEDRDLVLDPLRITNVPRGVLGPAVASLVGEGDRVMHALDILLSRAWR